MSKTVERRKKILIVDDEEGVRELLSEGLKLRGYEISTAVDGMDAVQQAFQSVPDLILLDVLMPKMDGWHVLERLRQDEKTQLVPIIMLTAKSETEALFRSEEHKAVDYFIKPINIQELLISIRRYI